MTLVSRLPRGSSSSGEVAMHMDNVTPSKRQYYREHNHRRHQRGSSVVAIALLSFCLGILLGRSSRKECKCNESYNLNRAAGTSLPSKQQQNDDGWNSIDVFYGNRSHLVQATWKHAEFGWSSQVSQDRMVFELLQNQKSGYFVDLASNDATYLSNTYSLETNHGWTGLCIEPNPVYWTTLVYRPHCQVVGAVVGQYRMEEVTFRFNGLKKKPDNIAGLYGGIVHEKFDNSQRDKNETKEAKRFTVTLEEIFQRNQVPPVIDYLSLDVEGAEEYILSTFLPLDRYTIRILTVERPNPTLQMLLKQHGYVFLKVLGVFGETLWAHDSQLAKLNLKPIGLTLDEIRDQQNMTIEVEW